MSRLDADPRNSDPTHARGIASRRFRDPLAWSAASKCLFAAAVFLTFTLWYWVALQYVHAHPEWAPYIDARFLPTALRILAGLLNEYLSQMISIAGQFGATVNQFVGDGIMAFFGAPESTDDRDHALRCVQMALAMQGRMAELRRKWRAEGIEKPFEIRIGINTGLASVGDFGSAGRMTYSAIGNQTNLTARIQEACEPGKVLVSHSTWALVTDEIRCTERGEIVVKGLHYPVRVYEVVAPDS